MSVRRRKHGAHNDDSSRQFSLFIIKILLILTLAVSSWCQQLTTANAWVLSPAVTTTRSTRTRIIHNDCPRKRTTILKQYKYNDDDDEEYDDDEPPDVDISAFSPPSSLAASSVLSYGWNKGRSSPTTRKAMGRSASSVARIHLCTNCGSEFVKWMGRCPTCKEWNTLQEHAVTRQAPAEPASSRGGLRPLFGRSRTSALSWLDGIASTGTSDDPFAANRPVRVTDLYGANNNTTSSSSSSNGNSNSAFRQPRIVIPNDDELNMVLGGGIMKGSLLLVGGEPGVGTFYYRNVM